MSFVSDQASGHEATADDRSLASEVGHSPEEFDGEVRTTRLGRYVLLHKLGQGGMGVVYAAYDEQLDRKVALKLLRSRSREAQQRLVREARAMARLSDPNVAQVYEICEDQQQTFMVVEFVDGLTLRRWLVDSPRSPAEIVQVFADAGRGLAAAHAEGIVHRDFKPENVMLRKDGRVLVMDFGLAQGSASEPANPASKDDTTDTLEPLTVTGALMGTPAYMAPEQFANAEIDGKTDQFSFCVALWEALYGQRPFQAATLHELARAVTAGERVEPSTPSWLHAVLVRGLQPNPDERWPAMDALLAQLQGDPSKRQRNRGMWAGIGALVCALAGGTALIVERTRAELEGNKAQLTVKDVELDAQRRLARDMANAQEAQQASLLAEQQRGLEALLLALETTRDYGPELQGAPAPVFQALFDAQMLDIVRETSTLEHPGCTTVTDIDIADAGAHVAIACLNARGQQHPVNVWSAAGELQRSLERHEDSAITVALSFDGSRIVTVDGKDDRRARLWDASGRLLATLGDHPGKVRTAMFSRDGAHIATVGGGRLRVWDRDGVAIFERDGVADYSPNKYVGRGEEPLASSPDGTRVVAACTDGNARVWDFSGDLLATLVGHSSPVLAVEWSADGRRIATASADRSARLWRASGEALAVFDGHVGEVNNVALAPDGSHVVTVSGSQVWLWDEAGNQLATLDGHMGPNQLTDLEFSPDGSRVAASNNGIHTWIWDMGGNLTATLESGRQTRLLEFFPDGSRFASAGFDPTPRLWQVSRRLLSSLQPQDYARGLAFAADDARVLLPGSGGSSLLWDVDDDEVMRFGGDSPVLLALAADGATVTLVDGVAKLRDAAGVELFSLGAAADGAIAVAFSPTGTDVAIASEEGVRVWDRTTRSATVLGSRPIVASGLFFAPDGSHVVALENYAERGGVMHVWTRAGVLVESIPAAAAGKFDGFAFAPNGTMFAAESNGELRFWTTATAEPAAATGVLRGVIAFAFSPNGKRILTAHDDAARLSTLDGRELLRLDGHALAVAHSPDGRYLATSGLDPVVRIWSAESGQLLATLEGHPERVPDIVFSHDSSRIATRSRDGTTRIWYMPRAMLRSACAHIATIPEAHRVANICNDL